MLTENLPRLPFRFGDQRGQLNAPFGRGRDNSLIDSGPGYDPVHGYRALIPDMDCPSLADPVMSESFGYDVIRQVEATHDNELLIVVDNWDQGHSMSPDDCETKSEAIKALAHWWVFSALESRLMVGILGHGQDRQLIYEKPGSPVGRLEEALEGLSSYNQLWQQEELTFQLRRGKRFKGCLVISDFLSEAVIEALVESQDRPQQTVVAYEVQAGLDDNIDSLPDGTIINNGFGTCRVDRHLREEWKHRCRSRRANWAGRFKSQPNRQVATIPLWKSPASQLDWREIVINEQDRINQSLTQLA